VDVLGIDHVEFFVGSARRAAHALSAAYGFQTVGYGGPRSGLAGQRSVLLAQGEGRILLTSALDGRHPAAGYVARHGEGVAAIALAVPDTRAAYARAVAAGAAPIQAPHTYERDGAAVSVATVSGFGDVVHRLVERRAPQPGGESAEGFLPGLIEPVSPVSRGVALVQGFDHAAVCVPAGALDSTVRFYREAFGLGRVFEEYIEVGGQGMYSQVVQNRAGTATFTLIAPDLTRRAGQIDDFLAWHQGPGVQHLALSTRDIAAAVRALALRGVGFAPTPAGYYDALPARLGPTDIPVDRLREHGILADRDHWGRMYQIFATSTHPRSTYFWELIERQGARTFGTSNIPALYAAKERELAHLRTATETAP
jgi:4-hydroxymandelate synthase